MERDQKCCQAILVQFFCRLASGKIDESQQFVLKVAELTLGFDDQDLLKVANIF